jgi:hypothetical protein
MTILFISLAVIAVCAVVYWVVQEIQHIIFCAKLENEFINHIESEGK